MSATNTQLATVSNISVTDTVPSGVTIVSSTASAGTASTSGQTLTWKGFALAGGQKATLTIRVSVTPTSSQVASTILLNPGANGTGTRSDGVILSAGGNAVSTGTVQGGRVTIAKTAAAATVNASGTMSYTITMTNSGNVAAAVTSVVDQLPAGFTFQSGSTGGTLGAAAPTVSGQTVTWSGTYSVPAGSGRTIVFSASAGTVKGTYTNTATVNGSNFTTATTGATAPVTVNAARRRPTTAPQPPRTPPSPSPS